MPDYFDDYADVNEHDDYYDDPDYDWDTDPYDDPYYAAIMARDMAEFYHHENLLRVRIWRKIQRMIWRIKWKIVSIDEPDDLPF